MTLVTVLSIVVVVSVYAVLVGTFTGGEVTVGGTGAGNVMYSYDNADPWTSTLDNASATWYSRVELATGGYSGAVTITWHLEQETDTNIWNNVPSASASTSIVLNGSGGNIYATSDGAFGPSNHNWGSNVAGGGTYRVIADIESV